VSLGQSADDAKLHHQARRTEGSSAPAAALDGYRATSELYIDELHTPSLHFSKKQRDVALKVHVASVHFKCFRGTLQLFHKDVAKIDRDIAIVAMVLYMYVASVCF
jgi:hypothetical protein